MSEPRCKHCRVKLSKAYHEPGCPERDDAPKKPIDTEYDPMNETDPEKLTDYLHASEQKSAEAKLEHFKRAWTGFVELPGRRSEDGRSREPVNCWVSCVSGGYLLFLKGSLVFIPDRSKEMLAAGLPLLGLLAGIGKDAKKGLPVT